MNMTKIMTMIMTMTMTMTVIPPMTIFIYLYIYIFYDIFFNFLFLARIIELTVILPDATTTKVKVPANDDVENVKKQIVVSIAM